MDWEKADIMFPEGVALAEDYSVPVDVLKIVNPPYTTTTMTKYTVNGTIEWERRLIWYKNGDYKNYITYEMGFNKSKLPDGQSALNIYGQKILKDRLLKIAPIQQVPYPPKKIPWWKKLFKKNNK